MSANMRVLVLGDVAPECASRLESEGLEVDAGGAWDDDGLLARLTGCDALVVGPAAPVTARMLQAGPRLRVVARAGVHVEDVDVDEATRRGIIVVRTPHSDVAARAEQALAMLFACARSVVGADAALRSGPRQGDGRPAEAVELRGKTLGLVGLDESSAALAEAAQALRMEVVACDPAGVAGAGEAGGLDRLDPAGVYAAADFIVVQPPPGEPDEPLIGDAELARMRHGVRLVAPAGPGGVDADALAAALAEGRVAATAVQMTAPESSVTTALTSAGDATFFPKGDGDTREARVRAATSAAEEVATVLRGGFPAGAVNVPVGAGDDAAELMPYAGLCARLGRLLVQLAGAPVDAVDITYGGSVAYFDTGLLTLAVLGGVLQDRVDGPVNFVNAQAFARDLGVSTAEHRQSEIPDYPRLVTVSCGPGGEVSVAGTSLGPEHKPRLVRVFGEDVDVEPARHMAFLRYVDAAGIGGKVGTLLGEWRVNIAHMSVGRGRLGDEAVMVLTLDQPLTPVQADELVRSCGLLYARAVEL
jgi:D-3-phosphoglycerate dehydrogenase / 2-oxoglutarate reductase